jgi:hypothetical protein
MTPPTVNAYYNPMMNEIVFPAGILQPPFFDPKADDPVNYGGMGAVIGHEMTHGFDDQGRQFDEVGNLRDWWSKQSAEEYDRRRKAVVDQYSEYQPLPGKHINGELTQGENIADIGGIRLAYAALQKALDKNPQAREQKIDGFTPEQRFFLGWAQVWRANQPPSVTANGLYQFHGGKNTRLEVKVDGAGGMDYVFLGKTLPFDRISSRLLFTNDRLQITDLRGALLSGTLRGNADISLAKNDPRYRANISVSEINFPLLTGLYYNYKTALGLLKGTYDFTGLGSDPRTMRGHGKLEITNGDVFAIPIFGPLSGILNRILPGSGYSIAHKATANFKIDEGIIRTDDFDADGTLFNMLGHGDIHFLDDKLDFNVRLNMKGPGVVLTPMYKLFEYAGTGSLKKPDWRPAVLKVQ